jgi:hypothetical protein
MIDSTTCLGPGTYRGFAQDCCPTCCIGALKSTLLNILNRITGEFYKVPWEKVIKPREIAIRLWRKGGQIKCEGKGLPM